MFEELVAAAGLEYACLAYGLDLEIIKNVTIKSQN